MQLDETENCYRVFVVADELEDGTPVLTLGYDETEDAIGFDKEQVQQLLPILEHFIKTGELPDAS